MNSPKFTIKKSIGNDYFFNLISTNDEIILKSEMYTTKQNCINGIDSVKKNSKEDSNYIKLIAANSKYYFNLKSADNGQVIGTSNLYTYEFDRNNAVEDVKRDAPNAKTEDLS